MTIITGKHLSRRTLLRGFGGAIALPFLDAMRPALASPAMEKRLGESPCLCPERHRHERLAAQRPWEGIHRLPRILKPLEPFRNDITVVSGLANHAASKAKGGGHARASGSFLSGMPPKYTAGADVRAGITFDQVAAHKWASEVRVPSLQIGCEDSRMVGNCDTGSSCAYTNSLSWHDPRRH